MTPSSSGHLHKPSPTTEPAANLPPIATLQAWVHRPQAVAKCFIGDIFGKLHTLVYNDGSISHDLREVFLLDHFPCRMVEIVAWVAGVVHKESVMTITLDEGNGRCVLEVVVRLAPAHIEIPRRPRQRGGGFRSASERKNTALAAKELGDLLLFIRPDIRVGDTVRVVGRVEEWSRGGNRVRHLSVDMGTGTGSISVVDSDQEYFHAQEVRVLQETLYARPFVFEVPTPKPSPSKSILSSVASELGDEDEEMKECDLPDPATLSKRRLTESTFKLYVLDHMTRETAKAMRQLQGRALSIHLQSLFPEYKKESPYLHTSPILNGVKTCQSDDATPRASKMNGSWVEGEDRSDMCVTAFEEKTPVSRKSFRSQAERERGRREAEPETAAVQSLKVDQLERRKGFRSRAERERARNDSRGGLTPAIDGFAISQLFGAPMLHELATRIVDTRAREEEKHRRYRVKMGMTTAQDHQLVADRLARGLSEGSYKLSPSEREHKMVGLATWAIRQAHAEGGLVQVATAPEAYLPLPPELLSPLLQPIVAAVHTSLRGSFRSRLERARDGVGDSSATASGKKRVVDAEMVTSRLRRWDRRWERVGLWAVEAALDFGNHLAT